MLKTEQNKDGNLELIREKLRAHLVDEYKEVMRNMNVSRLLEKPFSITAVLSVTTDQGHHRFIAKQLLQHTVNAAIIKHDGQANVEFNILNRLYDRYLEVAHCAVPRPVAMLPEIDSLIMEFVDGHLLENDLRYVHYFADRSRFKALQGHFYHCGRWLRYFQKFTGYRCAGPEAVQHIYMHCQDRLRMIEESGDRRCPRDLRERVTELLDTHIQTLSTKEVLVTGRHGDFGPWNIIVDTSGVTVFDFYGFQYGPVPVDVLKMLVFIERLRHAIPNSPRRVESLRERFLAGLGPLPEMPHSLSTLCEAMHRIVSIAGITMASSVPWFRGLEQSAILSTNLRWLLDADSRPQSLLSA